MIESRLESKDAVFRGPQTTCRIFLVLFLVGYCSRLAGYSHVMFLRDSRGWLMLAQGKGGPGSAPAQYRVLVLSTAYWISQHIHVGMDRVVGVLDLLGALTASLLLYRVLESSPAFQRVSNEMRWFGSAAFAALVLYLVDWASWYQKPETMTGAAFVAILLWLWTPGAVRARSGKQIALAVGILAITTLQAFVRADVAAAVGAGVFLAGVTVAGKRLSLQRSAALSVSALSIAIAAGVQIYLSKIRFPNATYGDVPVFMLRHDYKYLPLWMTCAIFIAPTVWTLREVIRRRFTEDGAGVAFLIGAVLYFLLFICVGRLDEVRILLPIALAIVPLTVRMVILILQEGQAGAGKLAQA